MAKYSVGEKVYFTDAMNSGTTCGEGVITKIICDEICNEIYELDNYRIIHDGWQYKEGNFIRQQKLEKNEK